MPYLLQGGNCLIISGRKSDEDSFHLLGPFFFFLLSRKFSCTSRGTDLLYCTSLHCTVLYLSVWQASRAYELSTRDCQTTLFHWTLVLICHPAMSMPRPLCFFNPLSRRSLCLMTLCARRDGESRRAERCFDAAVVQLGCDINRRKISAGAKCSRAGAWLVCYALPRFLLR